MNAAARLAPTCTVLLLVTSPVSASSSETSYHAHRERSLQEVEHHHARLVLTDMLKRLASAYERAPEHRRPALLTALRNDETLMASLPISPSASLPQLQRRLAFWGKHLPTPHLFVGEPAPRLLRRAHRIVRWLKSNAPAALTFESADPDLLHFTLRACQGNADTRSVTPWSSLTQVMQWSASFWNCEPLVRDTFKIVGPVRHPLDRHRLEALTHVVNSSIIQNLAKLEGVTSLPPSMSLLDALQARVPDLPNRQALHMLAAVSHNHGVETRAMTDALLTHHAPDVAVPAATSALAAINQLYRLVNEHHQARRAKTDATFDEQAPRPYHYWAAAFVGCEMTKRGYSLAAAGSIGTVLGFVYEQSSGHGPLSTQDVLLHARGSLRGASLCAEEAVL